MIIVAGPPGGGKSSLRPVRDWGVDWYNSDDRAAQMNGGSYHNIPVKVREAAGQQLQHFIDSHIAAGESFAFENALRTDSGLQQARRAKEMGFQVLMDYLAAGPVEEHIRRVKNRALLGGHSASERKLRDIYSNSMINLVQAFEESRLQNIDRLQIFDNSGPPGKPRLVLNMIGGIPHFIAAEIPVWLESALADSPFHIQALRALLRADH